MAESNAEQSPAPNSAIKPVDQTTESSDSVDLDAEHQAKQDQNKADQDDYDDEYGDEVKSQPSDFHFDLSGEKMHDRINDERKRKSRIAQHGISLVRRKYTLKDITIKDQNAYYDALGKQLKKQNTAGVKFAGYNAKQKEKEEKAKELLKAAAANELAGKMHSNEPAFQNQYTRKTNAVLQTQKQKMDRMNSSPQKSYKQAKATFQNQEEEEESAKEELQKFLQIYNLAPEDRKEQHYEFLKSFVLENPLFSAMKLELNNEELDKLVAMVKLKTFDDSAKVYSRGDKADCLYLVQVGKVYMTVDNPEHQPDKLDNSISAYFNVDKSKKEEEEKKADEEKPQDAGEEWYGVKKKPITGLDGVFSQSWAEKHLGPDNHRERTSLDDVIDNDQNEVLNTILNNAKVNIEQLRNSKWHPTVRKQKRQAGFSGAFQNRIVGIVKQASEKKQEKKIQFSQNLKHHITMSSKKLSSQDSLAQTVDSQLKPQNSLGGSDLLDMFASKNTVNQHSEVKEVTRNHTPPTSDKKPRVSFMHAQTTKPHMDQSDSEDELPLHVDFDVHGEPSELVVAQINTHQCFGELSVVSNLERQFNAHAHAGTRLFSIDREDFRSLVAEFEDRIYQAQIDYVRRVICFKGLSYQKLRKFTDMCKRVQLYQGQYLFKEGDKPKLLWIIAEGRMLVTKKYQRNLPTYETQPEKVFVDMLSDDNKRLKTRLKDGGQQVSDFSLEIKGKFQVCGMEDIIYSPTSHQTSVRVTSQSATLFTLTKEEFSSIQKSNPAVWNKNMKIAESKIQAHKDMLFSFIKMQTQLKFQKNLEKINNHSQESIQQKLTKQDMDTSDYQSQRQSVTMDHIGESSIDYQDSTLLTHSAKQSPNYFKDPQVHTSSLPQLSGKNSRLASMTDLSSMVGGKEQIGAKTSMPKLPNVKNTSSMRGSSMGEYSHQNDQTSTVNLMSRREQLSHSVDRLISAMQIQDQKKMQRNFDQKQKLEKLPNPYKLSATPFRGLMPNDTGKKSFKGMASLFLGNNKRSSMVNSPKMITQEIENPYRGVH